MDKDIKAKWVKALRSGEYVQTTDVLFDEFGGHCCLGVLCRVMGVEPLTKNAMGAKPKAALGTFDHLILAEMNDNGSSFAEIADYIETHL
jgi:hypothetical protein